MLCNELCGVKPWKEYEVRDNFVFVLANDQVFQMERWGRLSLAFTNLDIKPYILIDLKLKDLRLFLKCILALVMFNYT